ncbi:MAG TPA: MFS transporter [bacterium]
MSTPAQSDVKTDDSASAQSIHTPSEAASLPVLPAAPPPPRRGGLRSATRALKHVNYQLYFGGQLVSLIGTWMQSVAQSWLVYRLTGSELMLGVVGFCAQVPVFFLAAIGGTVADRLPRRAIIITTQTVAMCQATTLAVLTLTGHVQVWHVMILACTLGVVNAFDVPTRQSFVVEMVGKEDLPNAIALNSTMFNGARMAGPAIAGVLLAAVGEGWCFALNGVSYLAVLTSLFFIRPVRHAVAPKRASVLHNLKEAAQYIRGKEPVRLLLMMLAVSALMGMPYQVLMPIFAQDVLHAGPRGLGYLMSAAGVGALCAAVMLATRHHVDGLERWVGRASFGFGAALVAFSFSPVLWLSLLLVLCVGFCMMTQMASSNTLIQTMVPDQLRGRVMAAYTMMLMGMTPFGALIAGALGHRIGAPHALAVGGCVCMVVSLFYRRKRTAAFLGALPKPA